jgi:hypothetical protein
MDFGPWIKTFKIDIKEFFLKIYQIGLECIFIIV